MKKDFKEFVAKLRAASLALAIAALAILPVGSAPAQVVTPLPLSINANSVLDLGNGPAEFRVLLGNAWMFTSSSSGVGSTSGSSTTLTLTATPTTFPCVGCIISGTGITSGTTVTNASTNLTLVLSAAMNVSPGTAVSWGAACPSFGAGLPAPNISLQAGNQGSDIPMFTQARMCGYAANGPGAQLLPFPIGAH